MFVAMSGMALMAALAAGCAGPSSIASDSVSAAVAPVSDLAGTWYGFLSQVGANQNEDESVSTLEIKEDGTFTATVTPNRGANNKAQSATWLGTVVTNGSRVTLRNTEGLWPWIVLERSGHGALYGVAADPAIEGPVMIKFERGGGKS
jgi:hypothetical protein